MEIARFIDNWHHYCIQYQHMKPLYQDIDTFKNIKADKKYSYLTSWKAGTDHAIALEEKIRSHMSISDHVYVDLGEPALMYKDKKHGWDGENNTWEGPWYGTVDFVNRFEPDSNVTFFANLVCNHRTNRPVYYLNDMFFESRFIYREDPLCVSLLSKLKNGGHKDKYWELMCSNDVVLYDLLNDHPVKEKTFATCHKLGISHWGPDVVSPKNSKSGAETFGKSNLRVSDLIDPSIYNQSHYSCVVETVIPKDNSYCMFSEKEAKPIVACRPFIVVGTMGHLRAFRKLGFKTFSPVVDESYDDEPDMMKRYQMILDSMEKLCLQDPAEVYCELKPVLQHNMNHFYNNNWNVELQKAWLTPNLLSG